MSKLNDEQFNSIIRASSFGDPEDYKESDEYLDSFVECDNCGDDVHMEDAKVVKPTEQGRKLGQATNFYCGPECQREHQSGPRKGRIGRGADHFND